MQLPVGLIDQLVEHCTGIAEVMDSILVQAWIFFRPNFHSCLSSVHYCDLYTSTLRLFTEFRVISGGFLNFLLISFPFLTGNFKPRCDQAVDRKKMEQICFVLVQVFLIYYLSFMETSKFSQYKN